MIYRFCRDIGHYFKKLYFKDVWRKRNKHNFTIANEIFSINKVVVGKGTYGNLNVHTYGNEQEKLIIGNYCSISDNVDFILGGNHNYNTLSTYPVYNKLIDHKNESICKGPIIVKDDVWIGYGCKILSGVTIGQGAVVAAGSVVTKDIEPYAICGGSPAKIIKMRFNDNLVEKLKKINYDKLEIDTIVKYKDELNTIITDKNIDEITKKIRG